MIILLYFIFIFIFNPFIAVFSFPSQSSSSDVDVDQFLNLSDGEENQTSAVHNYNGFLLNTANGQSRSMYGQGQSKKGMKNTQSPLEAKKEARREALRLSQRRFIQNLKVNDPNKLREINRIKSQKKRMKDINLPKEQIEARKAKYREYARLQYQRRKESGGFGHTRDETMKEIKKKEKANTATPEELSRLKKYKDYLCAYSTPSRSSTASDSIDWDEYMNWPNDESHGAHHDDHMVKSKSVSDQHPSNRAHDSVKPSNQHLSHGTEKHHPGMQKKRKQQDSNSPSHFQKSTKFSGEGITEAQARRKAINRKYYEANQVELRKKRNEKYHQQTRKNKNSRAMPTVPQIH